MHRHHNQRWIKENCQSTATLFDPRMIIQMNARTINSRVQLFSFQDYIF